MKPEPEKARIKLEGEGKSLNDVVVKIMNQDHMVLEIAKLIAHGEDHFEGKDEPTAMFTVGYCQGMEKMARMLMEGEFQLTSMNIKGDEDGS